MSDALTPAAIGIAPSWRSFRRLLGRIRADPYHASELLVVYAVEHLGGPAQQWADEVRARYPDAPVGELAEKVRRSALVLSTVDGAVAGTPFLIALLPAYVAMLWEQARMTLRMFGLYGRPTVGADAAAAILVLRGAHPTERAAREAIDRLGTHPDARGLSRLRLWTTVGIELLVLAGFVSRAGAHHARDTRSLPVRAILVVGSLLLWILTWVVPVTFMLSMAWGGYTSGRSLGRDCLRFCAGHPAPSREDWHLRHSRQRRIAGFLFWLLLAVPLFILVLAVGPHAAQEYPVAKALAPLAGLGVVALLLRLSRTRGPL